MEQWNYYTPKFECDQTNRAMLAYSPWAGHRNFAYDLTVWKKPQAIVELGSYYGCSSFAFVQAIKDFDLQTEFYGVDTWAGDSDTKTDYAADNIYEQYKEVVNKHYRDSHIHMLRMTFDEAAAQFEEQSIDVLHIDGSHNYEDVKHDYETWKDKVKPNGIILFHDVGDDSILGHEVFGSNIFWNELKQKMPFTHEFEFSCGLGVLFLNEAMYQTFTEAVDLTHYQKINNHLDTEFKDALRKAYFELQGKDNYIADLRKQVDICQQHLDKYAECEAERVKYISDLETQIADNKHALQEYEKNVESKNGYIAELEAHEALKDKIMQDYAESVKAKDAYIAELEAHEALKDKIMQDYAESVKAKDEYIAELEDKIQ